MSSHAEPVRRHQGADPQEEPLAAPHETLGRPFSELKRYTGWLGKDHVSVAVRADVYALGAAMDVGTETSPLLVILNKNIGRLPSGDLRKIVQKAFGRIRAVLEPTELKPSELDEPRRGRS